MAHHPTPATPNLADLGWDDRRQQLLDALALSPPDHEDRVRPARVIRHDGASVLVVTPRETRHLHLRPAVPPLAVGDWITVRGDAVGELLERTSLLQRRDPSTDLAQPIAANVDIVGVVCGLDRPLSIGRIERFSALAWDAGATPMVILTKSDLVEDTSAAESEIYTSIPGTDVMSLSATAEQGVDELRELAAGKTLVLVGESGAGKSTLVNALAGNHLADTGAVRTGDSKGRHTTTARSLHVLPGSCCLIDTPGVREVGLFTDVETIDEGFDDIAQLATQCRFGDCEHRSEPGCAVLGAVEDGELAADRLESWRSLRREAASAELRADRAAYRQETRRLGKMYRGAMDAKQRRR